MSVFPLNIPEKTNTPALLAFFQQFGLDKYLSAEEINKITEALTELKEASENVSIVNTIFVNNGFEKVDQLFTAFANSEWNINGINYTNPTDQVITIPLCATGKVRTDRIVLDTNNNFVRVPGVEVDENPVAEAKPVNTLDYTFIPVNDAEVGDPSSPVIGNTYQQKQFDALQTYIGTGTDVVIPLNTTGRSHIQLKGTMTSIAGLSFADLVANPTNAEYPHYGKRYLFFNDSGHDIILKHLVGTEDIFFTFKEETDLVFPNGEFLEFFNGGSNVFVNVFRSWKDISNKLDKVTTSDVEKVYIKNADGTQGMKPVSELLSEILITNATVTGTYNIDYSAGDVWDLTLTGNTTLTESNAPASGFTKTITLEVSGNYTLTYPAGWTSKITGAYSGTATLNTITIQYYGTGKYKVLIVQPT